MDQSVCQKVVTVIYHIILNASSPDESIVHIKFHGNLVIHSKISQKPKCWTDLWMTIGTAVYEEKVSRHHGQVSCVVCHLVCNFPRQIQ